MKLFRAPQHLACVVLAFAAVAHVASAQGRKGISNRNLQQCIACPDNALPKRGMACPRSDRDCRCKSGFIRNRSNGKLECRCPNADCPPHSDPKAGVCIRDVRDCRCHRGFRKIRAQNKCECKKANCPAANGETTVQEIRVPEISEPEPEPKPVVPATSFRQECENRFGPVPQDSTCDRYTQPESDEYLRNDGTNMLNTASPEDDEPDIDPRYDPVYDAYCFNEDYPVPEYSFNEKRSMYRLYKKAFDEGFTDFSSVSENNNGVTNSRIPGMMLRMCFHDNTIDPSAPKFQDYVRNSIRQNDGKWNGPFTYLKTSGGDASNLICSEERLHPNNNYDKTATRVLNSIQKHMKEKYPFVSYADLLHNGCKAATLYLTGGDEVDFLRRNPFTFGRKDACHVDVKCKRRYPLCGPSEILPGVGLSAPAFNEWFLSRGMNECLWMSTMWTHTTMDNMGSMCPIKKLTCTAEPRDVDRFTDKSKLYFRSGDNLDYFDFFLKPGTHDTKRPITESSSCDWKFSYGRRKPWPLTAADCTLGLDNVNANRLTELSAAITNFHKDGYNTVDILGCALGMLSGRGGKERGICDVIDPPECKSPSEHKFGSFFSDLRSTSSNTRDAIDPLCGELGYTRRRRHLQYSSHNDTVDPSSNSSSF